MQIDRPSTPTRGSHCIPAANSAASTPPTGNSIAGALISSPRTPVRYHKGPRNGDSPSRKPSVRRSETLFGPLQRPSPPGCASGPGQPDNSSSSSLVLHHPGGRYLGKWASIFMEQELPSASEPYSPGTSVTAVRPDVTSVQDENRDELNQNTTCTEIAHVGHIPKEPLLKGDAAIFVHLRSGSQAFWPHEIPPPPAVGRMSASTLLAVWDDNSPLWMGRSPLVINGIPIPLKALRNIYGNGRSSHIWSKGVKQNWHRWNLAIQALQHNTELQERVTSNLGERALSLVDLGRLTRSSQQNSASWLATKAHREYGESYFTYRKGGTRLAYTDHRALARCYSRYQTSLYV